MGFGSQHPTADGLSRARHLGLWLVGCGLDGQPRGRLSGPISRSRIYEVRKLAPEGRRPPDLLARAQPNWSITPATWGFTQAYRAADKRISLDGSVISRWWAVCADDPPLPH